MGRQQSELSITTGLECGLDEKLAPYTVAPSHPGRCFRNRNLFYYIIEIMISLIFK